MKGREVLSTFKLGDKTVLGCLSIFISQRYAAVHNTAGFQATIHRGEKPYGHIEKVKTPPSLSFVLDFIVMADV